MKRLNDVLDMMTEYNADADLDIVKKAYVFAAKAHQGQTRRSGEPYLVHPVEVAAILAEMKLDTLSIAAALLHDTVEDTVATLEEIEQIFGKEVRELVDGVTKLSKIHFTTSEEKQAENFRKMIMAMSNDIRVIIIKLADRLHNMRTLTHMPDKKKIDIAQETRDIYAPIANRLGMSSVKIELEDLSLKYLEPEVYEMISGQIDKRKGRRDKYKDEVISFVKKELEKNEITAHIKGRLKHLSSIYRKMKAQNIPVDEIHDLVAFRIVVDTLSQCYEALGIIHSLWKPVPGRFKDYIAMPKGNNYQSLHTTVIGLHGERTEFQIRTYEMNEVAEKGIAAHWKYKERGGMNSKDEQKFKWIRQLLEWQSELSDPNEFLDTVKLDLFGEDVYVFTPNGQLRELPRGSTPVDFAYAVHTEVGNSCVGAKVNGKIVPLRYQMHSGDTVEIITQKGRNPNKDWLQFVKTSRAKAKIRQYVRKEEHDRSLSIGWELFEKECERFSLKMNEVVKGAEFKKYLEKIYYRDADAMMVSIGYGKLSALQVIHNVVPKDQLKDVGAEPEAGRISKFISKMTKRSRGLVSVSGMSDIMVSFGRCCNPVPGDHIAGYVTRGRGVSIHTVDCPRMVGTDPDRQVKVEWDKSSDVSRISRVKIVCTDRPGMLAAMSEAINSFGINIVQATSKAVPEDRRAVNIFDLEIKDTVQLRQLFLSLQKIKGIISVERVRG